MRVQYGRTQGELAVRFSNVYDAYSFLDMDGDWNLSANELLVGLRKLRIDTAHLSKEQTEAGTALMRALDKHNNNVIDPKTFISLLAWHPLQPNWAAALEHSRANRKQMTEILEVRLAKLDNLAAATPVKFLRSPRRSGVTAGAEDDRARSAPGLGGGGQTEFAHSPTSPEGSPQKSEEVMQHLAACAIQKRVRGMKTRKEMRISLKGSDMRRELGIKTLIKADQPSLGNRKLDLTEQEMLANIRAERDRKQRAASNTTSDTSDANPAVRGRRLDDNVTLPMNAMSLAKTQWLLVLFDYLCVRTDDDGRRTSKIGEGAVCRDIMLPETVIYRQHAIAAWHFSDAKGKMSKKQHTKEFTPSNILNAFLRPDRLHQGSKQASDQAAAQAGAGEGANWAVDSEEPVGFFVELTSGGGHTVTWLSRAGLQGFLKRKKKPRYGILQRFVRPGASCLHHETIRVVWSPNVYSADLCRNVQQWADVSKDLASRMGTFEAPLHQQHVTALTKVRAKQVHTATSSLVTHVNSLLPTGCSCWNAVLHFTINADSKLVFLYCSDMQIRSSADVRSSYTFLCLRVAC